VSRIQPIDPRTASGEAKQLLDAVQSQLGATPNFIRVLARSPKALGGFLGLYAGVGASSIDLATRERIALAVAEGNACDYCVAAHTAIGRGAGLSNEEMRRNREGGSVDAKAAAAVAFARALNDHRGEVTTSEFEAVRRAGYDDAQIVEIIAMVAMNVFTNLLGKSVRVDIDFPKVPLLKAAA
jgi:uncharacterized peroxidase-related enzyme